MARILGTDLPREKRVEIGLTYVYGIGLTTSRKILKIANIDGDKRVKDLSDQDVAAIGSIIQQDEFMLEGDLRRNIQQNIKRMMDIGCYRGLRHIRSLPARGQRTKTNSRTRKGKKRAVGKSKK